MGVREKTCQTVCGWHLSCFGWAFVNGGGKRLVKRFVDGIQAFLGWAFVRGANFFHYSLFRVSNEDDVQNTDDVGAVGFKVLSDTILLTICKRLAISYSGLHIQVKPGSKNAIQLILSLAIIIFYNN
jgi:hypothetical protein